MGNQIGPWDSGAKNNNHDQKPSRFFILGGAKEYRLKISCDAFGAAKSLFFNFLEPKTSFLTLKNRQKKVELL